VEENDYTIFTSQDLAFELELVIQAVAKKSAFIDNQVSTVSILYQLETKLVIRLFLAICRIWHQLNLSNSKAHSDTLTMTKQIPWILTKWLLP